MRNVGLAINAALAILLFLACTTYHLKLTLLSSFLLKTSPEAALASVGTISSIIVGSLSSMMGIFIAIYLIAAQTINHNSYSRITSKIYRNSDVGYFLIIIVSIAFSFISYILLLNNAVHYSFYMDVSILLFFSSILSILSILLHKIAIFNDKEVARLTLHDLTLSKITDYGLVCVEKKSQDDHLRFSLKQWGHHHNLVDPLGAFHDLLMEAINSKKRITMHNYLSILMETISCINGVVFKRVFGLSNDLPKKGQRFNSIKGLVCIWYRLEKNEPKIKATIHVLHYLVRRTAKLRKEWPLDNHRKLFTINCCDFIMALSSCKRNGTQIEYTLNAILIITLLYSEITKYGTYEPLVDMYKLSSYLKAQGFNKESNICLLVLALLDERTEYLSKSYNIKEVLMELPSELASYYRETVAIVRSEKNVNLLELFPNNLWIELYGLKV